MKKKLQLLSLSCLLLASCLQSVQNDQKSNMIEHDIDIASQQIGHQVEVIEKSGKILNPRTIINGKVQYISNDDWTSGFFPGTMWYMYELTNDEKWKEYGIKYTEALDSIQYLKWHHDIGFMIYCSFGNAYRFTGKPEYKDIIIEAAKSLSTRFRPVPGVIQSWDENRGWQGQRGWMCPVIIDNMMNLDLLFNATKLSGNPKYYDIAVKHAQTTMKNHFRPDYTSYHVVSYNNDGSVEKKQTHQGKNDDSAWSRGQAWGVYGYTSCYRETKDTTFLQEAINIADMIIKKVTTDDCIPYWDYDAPAGENTPRDASAAAITASALLELSAYAPKEKKYFDYAETILKNLSSDKYLAVKGSNQGFVLMHSTGSLPHGSEIDVPLNYADYYYLEALQRYVNLTK